jgi:hypothetical protein
VGASAGLTLFPDRYGYEFVRARDDGGAAGDAADGGAAESGADCGAAESGAGRGDADPVDGSATRSQSPGNAHRCWWQATSMNFSWNSSAAPRPTQPWWCSTAP